MYISGIIEKLVRNVVHSPISINENKRIFNIFCLLIVKFQVLLIDPLPSINKVYSMMVQEENDNDRYSASVNKLSK